MDDREAASQDPDITALAAEHGDGALNFKRCSAMLLSTKQPSSILFFDTQRITRNSRWYPDLDQFA
jgi:hypothetical protein